MIKFVIHVCYYTGSIINSFKIKCFIQRYETSKNNQVQSVNTAIDIDVFYDLKQNILKYGFRTINRDEDLVFLEVKDQNLKHLPRNIFDLYPNIESITAENTELMEIRYENLRKLASLRNLRLVKNKIDTLELSLFNDNPILIHVNLKDNRLFELDPKVFENLHKLITLNLDGNLCIDKSYDLRRDEKEDVIKDLNQACKGFTNMKKHINQKIQEEKEFYEKKVDHINSLKDDLELAKKIFMDKKTEIENFEKELKISSEKTESELSKSKDIMKLIGLITFAICAYLIFDLSLSVAYLLRKLHDTSFDQITTL